MNQWRRELTLYVVESSAELTTTSIKEASWIKPKKYELLAPLYECLGYERQTCLSIGQRQACLTQAVPYTDQSSILQFRSSGVFSCEPGLPTSWSRAGCKTMKRRSSQWDPCKWKTE